MIRDVKKLIDEIVSNFRLGYEAQANELMQQLPALLEPVMSTLPQSGYEKLTQLLTVVVDAQGRRDYVFVSDILKYEIVPQLSSY